MLVSFSFFFFLFSYTILFLTLFSHSLSIGICIWIKIYCAAFICYSFIFLALSVRIFTYRILIQRLQYCSWQTDLFTCILTFGLFLPFQSYLCWRLLYLPDALWMYLFHWNFFISSTTSWFLYDFYGTQKTLTNHVLFSTWYCYVIAEINKGLWIIKIFHCP